MPRKKAAPPTDRRLVPIALDPAHWVDVQRLRDAQLERERSEMMGRASKEKIKQRGGSWYCDFADRHTGERIRYALETRDKDEALKGVIEWQRWCDKRAEALQFGELVPKRPNERSFAVTAMSTVNDLIDDYWEQKGSTARSAGKRKRLVERWRCLGTKPLIELKPQDVGKVIAEWRRDRTARPRAGAVDFGDPDAQISPNTLNLDLATLTAMLHWGEDGNGYTLPPKLLLALRKLKLKKREYEQPLPTEDELRRLYVAMDPDLRLAFWFCYWSTQRQALAIGLMKRQITWDRTPAAPHGLMRFRQKGDDPRQFKLDATLRDLLETACAQTPEASPHVFTWTVACTRAWGRGRTLRRKGERYQWTSSRIDQRFNEACRRADIRPTTWHAATRAAGITRLADVVKNPKELMDVSGHVRIETLMLYIGKKLEGQAATLERGDVGFNPIKRRDGTNTAQDEDAA